MISVYPASQLSRQYDAAANFCCPSANTVSTQINDHDVFLMHS